MKKRDFTLQTRKWETLLKASSSIMETATPVPFEMPQSVLKKLVSDIVAQVQCEANRDKALLLADAVDLPVEEAPRREVLETVQLVMETMDAIHACFQPLAGSFHRATLEPVKIQGDHTALRSKLDAVLALVHEFAAGDVLGPYLRTTPPRQNVQKFQHACFRLCVQATYSNLMGPLDVLKEKMVLAMNASSLLVDEITQCHAFMKELCTVAVQDAPGTTPPLLKSLCKRAMLNFTTDAHRLLHQISPDAARLLFGQKDIPYFHMFQMDNLVKYQALIFDTWSGSADTTCLSTNLVMLANTFVDISRTPPFRQCLQRTSVPDSLKRIGTAFPDCAVAPPVTAPGLVDKAARLAALTLPAESLSHVYTQMIKQQAQVAICTHKCFVLNDVLEHFRHFYKRLRPPVFNAGILSLRVYQVYRDATVILGLPVEAPIAEKAFFQGMSETMVPDPIAWIPPPLVDRSIAGLVSMCRDLVLSYTKEPVLSQDWVDTLAVFLTGERTYSEEEVQSEYERIQVVLAS